MDEVTELRGTGTATDVSSRQPDRPASDSSTSAVGSGSARTRLTDILIAVRTPPWILALATFAVLATIYCLYSIQRHERFGSTGWDLGIFTQAVKAYGHFRAPAVPLEGTDVNLLGDHFQPWIAVIGPLYRLFPTPVTLLVVQGLLFALAAIPIVRLAATRLGVAVGVFIAIAYGLAWGIAQALAFDFHEIALAVPLLAFSLVAVVEERWRAALLYALPLVFCKEDLGVTVVVIAAVVALRFGRVSYRWAVGTAIWGAAWTLIAAKVIIPAMGSGDYTYESKFADSPAEGVRGFIIGLSQGDARASTAFLLLVITLFLAVRSPIILVAVPTLAWRFLSVNHLYWGFGFHYNATLMPIMIVAMLDALIRLRGRSMSQRTVVGFAAAAAAIAVVLAWAGPLDRLTERDFYSRGDQAQAVDEFGAMIPDGQSVATTNNLAPHLVADHEVTLFPKQKRDRSTAQWIMVDTNISGLFPANKADTNKALEKIEDSGQYVRVAADDGVVLLRLR